MVYMANDFKHLDDLYVADLDGRDERKLTNTQRSTLEATTIGRRRDDSLTRAQTTGTSTVLLSSQLVGRKARSIR